LVHSAIFAGICADLVAFGGMQDSNGTREWAAEQFDTADFGDVRRHRRATLMLRRAAERPAGTLSDVFVVSAERQAAYDFIESDVSAKAIMTAFGQASLRAVGEARWVYAVVDGTSLSLVDRSKSKGFGSIGKRAFPTRGLKVLDVLAVAADGTPVGLLDLEWWVRGDKKAGSRYVRRRAQQTETTHWVDVVRRTGDLVREQAPDCAPWFVIDREGDNAEILRAVAQPGQRFTIRATQNRSTVLPSGRLRLLHTHLHKQRVLGAHVVDVPAGPKRDARRAVLDVRAAAVVLRLPDRATGKYAEFPVQVVWARERRAPRGQARLDWMLLTSSTVDTLDEAVDILQGYCHRWRVEDFHRSWKRGHCNVEDTQLHTAERVMRWATLLAAVATRVERLKHLARTQPQAPATIELSADELDALRVAKIRIKSRVETIPDGVPSIAQAVRWIADLGGYTGKSSGGPPGSITIGRGLERLMIWTDAFVYTKELGKK
jgi:hypothetical protein